MADQHRREACLEAIEVGGASYRPEQRRAGGELPFDDIAVEVDEVALDRGTDQLSKCEQHRGRSGHEQQRDA